MEAEYPFSIGAGGGGAGVGPDGAGHGRRPGVLGASPLGPHRMIVQYSLRFDSVPYSQPFSNITSHQGRRGHGRRTCTCSSHAHCRSATEGVHFFALWFVPSSSSSSSSILSKVSSTSRKRAQIFSIPLRDHSFHTTGLEERAAEEWSWSSHASMQAVAASRQPAQRRKWRDEGLQGDGQTLLTDEERRVGIMNSIQFSIRFDSKIYT